VWEIEEDRHDCRQERHDCRHTAVDLGSLLLGSDGSPFWISFKSHSDRENFFKIARDFTSAKEKAAVTNDVLCAQPVFSKVRGSQGASFAGCVAGSAPTHFKRGTFMTSEESQSILIGCPMPVSSFRTSADVELFLEAYHAHPTNPTAIAALFNDRAMKTDQHNHLTSTRSCAQMLTILANNHSRMAGLQGMDELRSIMYQAFRAQPEAVDWKWEHAVKKRCYTTTCSVQTTSRRYKCYCSETRSAQLKPRWR
jgi:hypothetical protein